MPQEKTYVKCPPEVHVRLLSLELSAPAESVPATPLSELVASPAAEAGSGAPEMASYPASIKFLVAVDGAGEEECTYRLAYDVSFVTAHPCAPSHRVRMIKSPCSSTVQEIDVGGGDSAGKGSRSAYRTGETAGVGPGGRGGITDVCVTGHPLHKNFQYSMIHLSELLQKLRRTLAELVGDACMGKAPTSSQVLVVDCMTNIGAGSAAQSPELERVSSWPAAAHMYLESQKRQFGSDMEVLVRAVCALRGWNAIISRRRRGCLACAIREAGALGWRVILRVD